MNTAIIVAAGSGSRFGSDTPKQFANLCGKPVITHTIERFEACDTIDQIVLVLSESGAEQCEIAHLRSEIKKICTVVIGGATRAESVKNGFDAIDAATAKIVAVHDGARPLVTVDEITRTIEKASEVGAACLVTEVTDTIKEIRDGNIVRTIDRWRLRRALTPQAFRYEILKRAFEGTELSDEITDESSLVERLDNYYRVAVVEGSSRNIKITRPEDLELAEVFLSEPSA